MRKNVGDNDDAAGIEMHTQERIGSGLIITTENSLITKSGGGGGGGDRLTSHGQSSIEQFQALNAHQAVNKHS